jgi:hypothetical protein
MKILDPMKYAKFSSLSLTKAVTITLCGLGLAVQAASAAVTVLNPTGITVQTNSLTIAAGSTLDIAGTVDVNVPANVVTASHNAIILNALDDPGQAANVAMVYSKLVLGYNLGDWLGAGITSGTVAADAQVNGVLGVQLYDNTQVGFAKWGGVTLTDPNFRETLLRVTYIGDLDGNGLIDSIDYSYLDAYRNAGFPSLGDLNYDGVINSLDYSFIDAVRNAQVYGNLGDASAFTGLSDSGPGAVPEPATCGLLFLGVALLGCRRRCKASLA